jgi:hypothetical protein
MKTQCLGGQIVSAIYPVKLGTKGLSSRHKAVMFFSDWALGFFLGWLMGWQLGNRHEIQILYSNVLKTMFQRSSKNLPQRDQDAMERADFKSVMFDAARETFAKGREPRYCTRVASVGS